MKLTEENIKIENRLSIAIIYADEILKNLPDVHYAEINRIILTKYKNSGLAFIKELAWKILEKRGYKIN